MGQCDVAAICEWCDHQAPTIANILIAVDGRPITNSNDTGFEIVWGVAHKVHTLRAVVPVKAQLRQPLEVGAVRDLCNGHLFHNVTAVHINGDQGDDLVAHILAQLGLDAFDQLFNALIVHSLVVLHGGLTSTFDLLEHTVCLLRPHDLCAHQSQL